MQNTGKIAHHFNSQYFNIDFECLIFILDPESTHTTLFLKMVTAFQLILIYWVGRLYATQQPKPNNLPEEYNQNVILEIDGE